MEQIQLLLPAIANWVAGLIIYTDPNATYGNPDVQQLWEVSLYVSDVLSGIFIVWAGYQIIFAGFTGLYARALDFFPRIGLAIIGANLSLRLGGLWIDFSNYLSNAFFVQKSSLTLNVFAQTRSTGPAILFVAAVLGIFMLLLGLEMVGRLALLNFFLVILPFLMLLLANRSTERIGWAGLEAYLVAVIVQVGQVIVIVLGDRMLVPFVLGTLGKQSTSLTIFITLLVGIALFALALQLPVIVGRMVLHPVVETGGAVRTLLTTAIARLI